MSKVALTGNNSGTGTFTIAAPNSNNDRTLTLPDEAGTVLSSNTPLSSFPSGFANGITMADQFRMTSNLTVNTDPITNLERTDNVSFSQIGNGMGLSSGVFTFPETGIYLVINTIRGYVTSGTDTINCTTMVSVDGGSNWDVYAQSCFGAGVPATQTGSTFAIVDVTNTSNVKVKFELSSVTNGLIEGSTSNNRTHFTFIRLGDT